VAIVPLVKHPIGERELDRLPSLRVIANYGVGYDNISVEAARERGILVTNTPDVLTDATADLTLSLILAAARRLREGLELAVSGKWTGWDPTQLLGLGMSGKTLGLVGAGRIGAAVARRAAGFGLSILYWNRSPSAILDTELGAQRCESLSELLERSDIVSIHLPLSDQTAGLIGRAQFQRMKRDAILVNTARGPIIDEAMLVTALQERWIAAAGLDVFESEPDIGQDLRALPNAYILPHLGSATREARQGMWDVAAANVRAVLAGEAPLTPVGA